MVEFDVLIIFSKKEEAIVMNYLQNGVGPFHLFVCTNMCTYVIDILKGKDLSLPIPRIQVLSAQGVLRAR
jgi:hypothetical protein